MNRNESMDLVIKVSKRKWRLEIKLNIKGVVWSNRKNRNDNVLMHESNEKKKNGNGNEKK